MQSHITGDPSTHNSLVITGLEYMYEKHNASLVIQPQEWKGVEVSVFLLISVY